MRELPNIEFDSDSFSRLDETDDALLDEAARFIDPVDAIALVTVERIIRTLVVESSPVVLDLMAGANSHLPEMLKPAGVVGLGLHAAELARNPVLTESVVQDLNRDSDLQFPDSTFDVVLNTLSVPTSSRRRPRTGRGLSSHRSGSSCRIAKLSNTVNVLPTGRCAVPTATRC